ncbi:hypothetical protein GCM10012275_08840 [Longimycelium tulufanense]|uniref:DUF3558 domain-containing protein n=2 Tax=Longimycelium tulufanense TaxID=907463 RepID=A0A8J3FSM4_9PSEU|nr:hypothetical protein GCM10012275_08840 [Longimycelium tulufanense]
MAASTRPREIKLDGKDPCGLISAQQRAKFSIEREPRPGTSDAFKASNCSFSTKVGVYRITAVTTEGVEAWRSGNRTGKAEEQQPIAGFPAIAVTLPNDDRSCSVAVDVADGQYLYSTAQVDKGKESELPAMCEAARQFAEAAMTTLTASS